MYLKDAWGIWYGICTVYYTQHYGFASPLDVPS
jgi:hypothetical protein